MFRCDHCENYYDKSNCYPYPPNEMKLLCEECFSDWAEAVYDAQPNNSMTFEEFIERLLSPNANWLER